MCDDTVAFKLNAFQIPAQGVREKKSKEADSPAVHIDGTTNLGLVRSLLSVYYLSRE